MFEQRAQVIGLLPGKVELAVELQSGCSGCQSADTCSSGTVAKAFSPRRQNLVVDTRMKLAKGQWVQLGVEQQGVLSLAAVTYLLPLLGLILGGALGQGWLVDTLGYAEPLALLLAMAGSFTGFIIGRRRARAIASRMGQPVILGLTTPGNVAGG